ncbi:TlpA family protein disulfide reductase [Lutibacter sp. B2]|nr:TlpA family protein disulfide reductase [Lutibacter sp. B2]
MKKILIFVLCITMMLSIVGCSNKAEEQDLGSDDNPVAGKVMSEFTTKDIEGNEVTQEIFKDKKITMINVWGTFCGPCIEEMPDLQKIYEEYKGEDFNLIGLVADVELGNDPKEATEVVNQTGVKYKNILVNEVLNEEILSNFDYVPFTIFVNAEGKILDTMVAGSLSYEGYKSKIDTLLKNEK